MDEAWVSAFAGFVGVLVGTGIGAFTTWKVHQQHQAEERRRHSAGIVGRLKRLLDFYSPGRWMASPEVLDKAYEQLATREKEWLDISPELLSLPVFYPNAVDLVESIYQEMNGLTRGTWMLARHSAKGLESADRELIDLERRQSELRKSVNYLMREMWAASG